MKKLLFLFGTLFLVFGAFAQNFTLSGYVRDITNGETLQKTNVSADSLTYTTNSNAYGFYSLTLPAGKHVFRFAATGFNPLTDTLLLDKNLSRDVQLAPFNDVGVVVINAKRDDNVRRIDISSTEITGATIHKIPSFLGEADVIKAVQMLPGVTTVGEGATGFNVRGGSIDQNLVLLDEAPVFNSAHLFGFFSIFNPDAVKDVQLVKGGIPANYGGRLSSTLDVRMKDGNKKKYQVNGGVGTIFSRLLFEGPILKNKASFVVAARRSYIDYIAKPFLKANLKGSQFFFYDFTAKVNYSHKRDNFFISAYLGDDVFNAVNSFGVKWGNSTITGRWNHVFNKKLFANFTYYYSRYRYNIEFKNGDASFNWQSYIVNNSVKADLNYYITPKNQVSFGAQSIYYTFIPGRAVATQNGAPISFSLPDKYGWENAVYISNDYNSAGRFSMRYGLRLSNFTYLGKSRVYYYSAPEAPGQRSRLDQTRDFGTNEFIANYLNLEPRAGFKYELRRDISVKGGYNRMVQNIHLISNTAASVPFDVWQPTTNNIKPEKADQYTLGLFRNYGKNADFETSFEVYYKDLQNQLDYVDGADLLLNELLEGELLSGIGRAYGAELYLKKNTGKFTGWIAYTLSRSEKKVLGINGDKWFPNRFDRAHNLYVVMMYAPTKKWEFAANFVFSTGTPTTFYTSQYSIQGYNVPDPGGSIRNNVRNPLYHRLDLSATWYRKRTEKYESHWVFSVYNTYNRRNPFSIYYATNFQDKGLNAAIRYSIIGSIVPAISYNFKFK